MDLSDQWRSLWPISSVFSAPNLLSAAAAEFAGPLLFRPSQPPLVLLSCPSLVLNIPPSLSPSSFVHGLHASLRSLDNDSFLPAAAAAALAADILSSLPPFAPLSPNLHSLLSPNTETLTLFFPTGENAHSIGFLSFSFKSGSPDPRLDTNGGTFMQKDGFKHPYHRILKISVVATSAAVGPKPSGNSIVEGMLVAATMYSVNWFRVESRVLDSGEERRFVVPVAKQGFERSVVHACCSPHFPEESAVLLDDGELCWFNLNTKRGGKVRVVVGSDDPGEWLSCEFGGQPWILLAACSTAVVVVDLRAKLRSEPKFLARVGSQYLNPVAAPMEKMDRFVAFCRSGFSDFYVSVLSERQLLLFDTRQPLLPVLMWDHGLDRPSYVAMFRLSELRPSVEFKWASESGFAIVVGSFWDDEFDLFCYGPREGRAHDCSASLYAWELPSCLPLSGRQCGFSNHHLKDGFLKVNFQNSVCSQQIQKKDVLVGFCIIPAHCLKVTPESNGFTLIRLMLSGKLEMQSFHASWDLFGDRSSDRGEDSVEKNASTIRCKNQVDRVSTRFNFIRLRHLYEYMNGSLSTLLAMSAPQSYHKEINQNSFSQDLMTLSSKLQSSNLSVSSFVSDASIPISIFEIALRRALASLQLDLLPLAFSKYSDLLEGNVKFIFELLEVPSCLPHHSLLPFFTGKPSRLSGKWLKKTVNKEALVGPLLPLPVLLTLQQMFTRDTNNCLSLSINGVDDDILNLQCQAVLQNVFPAISIADSGHEWETSQDKHEEKPFFVHEPSKISSQSTCNTNACTVRCGNIEEVPQTNPVKQTSRAPEGSTADKRFTTFICGIAEKTSSLNFGHEPTGLEMLDLSPVRLDFDSPTMLFQPQEQEIYQYLKSQFSKWQDNYKPYQDFCKSSKIPKTSH